MIGQECIDELADFAGLKAHVAAITERAMRGEIEFEPALRERVALLKGLPVGVVDEVLKKAHHADAGRPHAGRDHARPRRLHLPDLRRLHAVHRRGRRDDRVSGNRANELMVADGN
jgi:phosphoserine phosphatase